jgi:hypothetical protein
MRLVMTLIGRGETDVLDAQIAIHLGAGVDHVVATCAEGEHAVTELLEAYAARGSLHLVGESGEVDSGDVRTRMAQVAATDLEADWLISCDPNEFWWPRGASLKDILAPIPTRYTAVQGLVRTFVGGEDDGVSFPERMTVRRSLRGPEDAVGSGPSLRLAYRARPDLRFERSGQAAASGRIVPLRGWYPIEVMRLPEAEQPVGELERGLADGSLVADTRLRDALRSLRATDGEPEWEFPVPNVVDDAAYAVECAALGEVDFDVLERRIEQLEQQLASLEHRFWSRVWNRVSRPAGLAGRQKSRA